jgi:epoxyqueuosine reductase
LNKQAATTWLKSRAKELGFSHIGISQAEQLSEEAIRLKEWLDKGLHGEMHYMTNHFEKRVDPTKLVTGAKSVISLAYNYYTPKRQSDPNAPKVSIYAFGEDYHVVIRKKLKILLNDLEEVLGPVQGRCFVDSAPVMERDWARRSGLGWVGKHTLLIHPKKGSYFFLAELIVDLELIYDDPIRDHCGTCRKCIDACPTGAIHPDGYLLDSRKCISYLTIELRDNIPESFEGEMENYVFGCDICQEVCPWNRFSDTHSEPEFEPDSRFLDMPSEKWDEITPEVYEEVFKKTPLERTGYQGLKRNIAFLKQASEKSKTYTFPKP